MNLWDGAMWQTKIENLTAEQKALIPIYREKWHKNMVSTEPIDRQRAANAVKAAYSAMEKREPEILFISSPDAIKEIVGSRSPQRLVQMLGTPLLTSLQVQLSEEIESQIDEQLWLKLENDLPNEELLQLMFIWQDALAEHAELLGELWVQWQGGIIRQIWEQQQKQWRQQLIEFPGGDPLIRFGDVIWQQVGEPLSQHIEANVWQHLSIHSPIREWEEHIKQPLQQIGDAIGLVSNIGQNLMASSIEMLDFCISVLECSYNDKKWQALQGLVKECGFVLPLENTCLVCDRPIKLSMDEQNRFHREGGSAIRFIDGYRIYAYHGVKLPEKYGLLHPERWQVRWLLEEENAELRRVLIQGIGYGRICQELQAVELDSWREYTLLRIDNDIDVEPIYLLKMTCPSTNYIHATRVPPDISNAREAITWVNWGVDPEEFMVET
ncbi:MAG: hypothetical protein F6K54_23935 [Okeania sp. SIO3B5]|uniref:DUF6745 domain-containing protein n=1 Tax=Okeania sp. SIO3B5 TaxID=2607811 RepID=UPI001401334B|nr:hypothetical protein [Okeania sp. SIO3B5]NEO55849.1 hypothetical protein [Okeania sp. SIO3B5]